MVFVDSNFWIGLLNKDDKHSIRAFELATQLQRLDETIYVTSGVVHEVVNHLFKIKGKEIGITALTFFLSANNLEIIFLSQDLWKNETQLFIEHEINLTDAQILAAMQEKNELVVYSFDKHFGQDKKIKRIY